MFNVSVVETHSVTRAVFERYGFDISHYTMSSLRLRIDSILNKYKLLYTEVLIDRILEDPDFLDTFIKEISIGSPDLFRDPDLWMELRDVIIPELLEKHSEFDIIVPGSVTGDELFSLAILLNESGWTKKIRVITTCLNNEIIDSIMEGFLSPVRYKTSLDNYRIFNPDNLLDNYLSKTEGKVFKSGELLKQIRFLIKRPTVLPVSNRTRLILFRNRLLYMNQAMKTKILSGVTDKMAPGSYLILGIRESLKGTGIDNMLLPISPDLNVYIKSVDE